MPETAHDGRAADKVEGSSVVGVRFVEAALVADDLAETT